MLPSTFHVSFVLPTLKPLTHRPGFGSVNASILIDGAMVLIVKKMVELALGVEVIRINGLRQ
jgi:hypothetical protein